MNRRALVAALVVVSLSAPAGVAAEPVHLLTPSTVVTDGGSNLRLPPSICVEEQPWEALDLEMHRLQDAETRLTAENKSLRQSAAAGPGWGTVTAYAITFAAGIAAAAYALR